MVSESGSVVSSTVCTLSEDRSSSSCSEVKTLKAQLSSALEKNRQMEAELRELKSNRAQRNHGPLMLAELSSLWQIWPFLIAVLRNLGAELYALLAFCSTVVKWLLSSICSARVSVSSQAMCWELLTCTPGTVALLCRAHDLKVLKATKKACRIWGTFELDGSSLLSLVKSQARGEALVAATRRMLLAADATNGIAVNEFGCIEMITKSGRGLDCVIQVAKCLEEPCNVDGSNIIVIFEPFNQLTMEPQRVFKSTRPLEIFSSAKAIRPGIRSLCRDINNHQPWHSDRSRRRVAWG